MEQINKTEQQNKATDSNRHENDNTDINGNEASSDATNTNETSSINQNAQKIADSQTDNSQQGVEPWLANRFIRVLAYIVDGIVLTMILYPLTYLFEHFLSTNIYWALLIGFLVGVGYFGIQNSHVFHGQTLAKRLFKIRVVTKDNQYLSLGQSCLRAAILSLPFTLSGITLPSNGSLLLNLASLVIFGSILVILYLLIFNKLSKQNIHDLVVGSYVVNSQYDEPLQQAPMIAKVHKVVMAVVLVAAAVAPSFSDIAMTSTLATTDTFEKMKAIQSDLAAMPEVLESGVANNYSTVRSITDANVKPVTSHHLVVTVRVNDKTLLNSTDFAKQVATLARAQISSSKKVSDEFTDVEVINVVITYGYNLVLLSQWHSGKHAFNYDDLSLVP